MASVVGALAGKEAKPSYSGAGLPNLSAMRWTAAKTDPKILEELVWAEVARAFAAGATGPELSRKFGFGESTFYAHAKAGGWQRKQVAAREQAKAGNREPAPKTADRVLEGLELTAPSLEADAAQLARKALALVVDGDGKGADAALKAADRLLRIKRRLGSEPESSKSEEALGRLMAMSDAELEAEILRLAGGG
jgi:hypothetical protein